MSGVSEEFDSSLLNTPESWEKAGKLLAGLGAIPASFQSTIRMLRSEHAATGGDSAKLSPGCAFNVRRLVKSPSLMGALYYAAKTYYPAKLEGREYVSDRDLVKVFSPIELASIFGVLYAYRKVRRSCETSEWEFITKMLHDQIDVAGYIGCAMPSIGLSSGILLGAARPIALALISKKDEKGFREYRRVIKNKPVLFDAMEEQSRWGYTSIQLGSLVLQRTGLGIDFSTSMSLGVTTADIYDPGLTKDTRPMKTADVWLTSLLMTGKVPDIRHRGEFYPLEDRLAELLSRVDNIRTCGSPFQWLEMGKEDVSPELTPQLFKAGTATSQPDAASVEEGSSSDEASDEGAAEVLQELEA